jgi:hypothetical protein
MHVALPNFRTPARPALTLLGNATVPPWKVRFCINSHNSNQLSNHNLYDLILLCSQQLRARFAFECCPFN